MGIICCLRWWRGGDAGGGFEGDLDSVRAN
jgi:hypothetical protein